MAIPALFTLSSYAQTFADSLTAVLKKKSVNETETFILKSKHMDAQPVLYRQIVGDYFEYSFEARTSPGYKICFLGKGDTIVYSEVLSGKKKIIENESAAGLKEFYTSYGTFFGTNGINIKMFFTDTVRYGRGCGFAGVDPPERKRSKKLLDALNAKTFLIWLRSPVTEDQLYAVEGLTELEKRGYKLKPQTKKVIDFIKTKKGKAKTCNGCIYSDREISEIFTDKN